MHRRKYPRYKIEWFIVIKIRIWVTQVKKFICKNIVSRALQINIIWRGCRKSEKKIRKIRGMEDFNESNATLFYAYLFWRIDKVVGRKKAIRFYRVCLIRVHAGKRSDVRARIRLGFYFRSDRYVRINTILQGVPRYAHFLWTVDSLAV